MGARSPKTTQARARQRSPVCQRGSIYHHGQLTLAARERARGESRVPMKVGSRGSHRAPEIIVGVRMGTWKTRATVLQYFGHLRRREVLLEQEAGHAIIGDTPVRLRKALPEAQGVPLPGRPP